jgi:hypothetical protein
LFLGWYMIYYIPSGELRVCELGFITIYRKSTNFGNFQ